MLHVVASQACMLCSYCSHPVYFKKTSAAPFGNRSPQLWGAWVCIWADLQNLQGGAAPPHQTETRWTKKEKFLCLSAPLVKSPHFGRLLWWIGFARYSRNYSGCSIEMIRKKLKVKQRTSIMKCSHKRKAFIRSANVVLSLCSEKKARWQ